MAKFVTLYRFTDEGIRNVKDSPARVKAGIQKAEALGMKVLGTLYGSPRGTAPRTGLVRQSH